MYNINVSKLIFGQLVEQVFIIINMMNLKLIGELILYHYQQIWFNIYYFKINW